MFITLSSTRKNERIGGKIQKYYITCRSWYHMKQVFSKVKKTDKTFYVSYRFSTPKYKEETHKIVDSFKNLGEFVKEYKKGRD